MRVAFRAVAVSVMLSLAWAGPLAPFAMAQQPATPPAESVAQAPVQPPAQPTMFQEEVKPVPTQRGTDVYDVASYAITAAGLPIKVALCGLGISLGLITLGVTFASRPDATVGIINEGCGGKANWLVRGSDIRPRPTASKAFDWETHRFEWEK
jgi:hypothetical protein